jgi:hypothetical protein
LDAMELKEIKEILAALDLKKIRKIMDSM